MRVVAEDKIGTLFYGIVSNTFLNGIQRTCLFNTGVHADNNKVRFFLFQFLNTAFYVALAGGYTFKTVDCNHTNFFAFCFVNGNFTIGSKRHLVFLENRDCVMVTSISKVTAVVVGKRDGVNISFLQNFQIRRVSLKCKCFVGACTSCC